MLSSDQIAAMKATADATALPETSSVSRATLTSDGMGGFTESWAVVSTPACRVDPPGNVRLDLWIEKIQDRSAYILNFPAGSNVAEGDHVTVGAVVYLVLGLLPQSWEITRRAVVVAI